MTGTAAAAMAVSPADGVVHLVDYSDNDGAKSTVILTRAIGDYDEAVSVNPDGSTNPEHNSELNLVLTHGWLRLDIADLDEQLVAALSRVSANSGTCSRSVRMTDTAPIVAGSCTCAYRGLSGGFQLTVSIDGVDAKPTCDGTGAYPSQAVVITGPGTVSLSQPALATWPAHSPCSGPRDHETGIARLCRGSGPGAAR